MAQIVEKVTGDFLVVAEIAEIEILLAGAQRAGLRLEIAAGGESAALAGDDHYLDVAVMGDLVAQDIQLNPHADIDRVQKIGTV